MRESKLHGLADLGVDIGGTFTDVALVEEASGRIGVVKVPSTPADLAEGVLRALELAMSRYGVDHAEVELLSHATTVVTNAILEENGARAALITTRGFRDVRTLGARRAPIFMTCFRTHRRPSYHAVADLKSASGSVRTVQSSHRSPKTRSMN